MERVPELWVSLPPLSLASPSPNEPARADVTLNVCWRQICAQQSLAPSLEENAACPSDWHFSCQLLYHNDVWRLSFRASESMQLASGDVVEIRMVDEVAGKELWSYRGRVEAYEYYPNGPDCMPLCKDGRRLVEI